MQVVQLSVIWAKSHVIANKQQALYGPDIVYCVFIAVNHSLERIYSVYMLLINLLSKVSWQPHVEGLFPEVEITTSRNVKKPEGTQ